MKNKIILASVFVLFALSFASTVFADTKINLQIKTDTATIYNNEIIVAPCDSEGGTSKITPYCALDQLEKSGDLPTKSIWIYGGLYVDSINGVSNVNDDVNKIHKNWMWLVNLNIDMSSGAPYTLSAKQYILQDNDNILFYYNTNPLDITVDNENSKVGDNIKIIGKELGLDSSWNPVWNNAVGGKVIINGSPNDLDSNGEFSYEIKSDDKLSIKIQKDNFIDSKELNIQPEEIVEEVPPPQHGSSGSYITNIIQPVVVEKVFSLENALKFLEINQKSDGSYSAPMYTDWVAIATGAGDDKEIESKLINYLKENGVDSSVLTDNERRAMALMSLGINPYSGTSINYIKKITDSFDGAQFGDSSLLNDDIFALVVLKNAGYNGGDGIIIKDINYIISKQDKEGSWGSIDMTAAGTQALKSFENIAGVNDAISKSENYIIANQKPDGGFDNSFSTSWALQIIYENSAFTTQTAKAENYLASKQQLDGGLENITDNIDTRIWATSYAIPAILHKPWNEILNNFSRQEVKVSPRQGLGEDKVGEVKKINKGIIKKSEKTLEDRAKIENLIEDNSIPQNNKIQSKASRVWVMLKAPFSWLLLKLGF